MSHNALGRQFTQEDLAERHPDHYGDAEDLAWATGYLASGASPGEDFDYDTNPVYRLGSVRTADLHPRVAYEGRVDSVRRGMREGTVPPILVVKRGGEYLLADGNHRATAAQRDGQRTMTAYIHEA